MHIPLTKYIFCLTTGYAGTVIISLIGGWGDPLRILLIFMAVDYLTGFLVAAVFKKSTKTKSGALSSQAGLKGICRKIGSLIFVVVANQLDSLVHTDYIRTMTILALTINETISLVENLGLMGLPVPPIIMRAIDVLKTKQAADDASVNDDKGDAL